LLSGIMSLWCYRNKVYKIK